MRNFPGISRFIPTLCLAAISSAAHAGGLYIGEFGQPNMGASGAGAQAIAEDASTVFQNPAGIMFLENRRDCRVTQARGCHALTTRSDE